MGRLASLVDQARDGDVVAMMTHQDREQVDAWLVDHGASRDNPDALRAKVAVSLPAEARHRPSIRAPSITGTIVDRRAIRVSWGVSGPDEVRVRHGIGEFAVVAVEPPVGPADRSSPDTT